MRCGIDAFNRHASVQCDFYGDVVTRALAAWHDHRSDAPIVWHALGSRKLALRRFFCLRLCFSLRRCGRCVALAYDHRERKLVSSVLIFQCLDVADGDFHLRARHDVGYGLSEDVWALLIQKACYMASCASLTVCGLRLFAPHYLAAYGARAYQHCHVVNGCRLRQREDINGLYLFVERVFKLLRDRDARDKAAYLRFDIRMFQWA